MSARPQPAASWLDPVAAAVPAVAAAWSAALLAPLFEVSATLASPVAGLAMFAAGWGAMRLTAPRPAPFPLRIFQPPAEEPQMPVTTQAPEEADVLVLDRPLAASMDALAELLLDDPLPPPSADSRVVQLFPSQPPASPGELKRRIDRHLGLEAQIDQQPHASDAADSLRRALDELRQTLAQR